MGPQKGQLNTSTLQHIWQPSTSNSNTQIWEQADPWGQELASKEAQRMNFPNKDRKNNGRGHRKGS